jgi:hypothetical protein
MEFTLTKQNKMEFILKGRKGRKGGEEKERCIQTKQQ